VETKIKMLYGICIFVKGRETQTLSTVALFTQYKGNEVDPEAQQQVVRATFPGLREPLRD
jgi:hypothetical protein